MNRKLFTAISIIITSFLLLCFVSCEENNAIPVGSLNISIDNTTRAIEPNISLDVSKYEVSLLNGDGTPIVSKEIDKSHTSLSQNNIPVGSYTVKVDAKNKDGVIIGTGSKPCVIEKDKTTEVNVTVSELSGTGNLSVTLTGAVDSNVTYTLTIYKSDDTEFDSVEFAIVDTSLKAEIELDNGFYYFVVTDGEGNASTPEAFRIVKGDTLNAEAYICESFGSLRITITNSIVPNPSLTLNVSDAIIHEGEEFTVSATGMSGESLIYSWYVNEKAVEGSANTLTLTLDVSGDYTIRCLVQDSVSSVVWSCKKIISIKANGSSGEKTVIRVLNYMDTSEPNSANEVEMVWNEFSRLHPEIEVIREDLYGVDFHQKVVSYVAQGNLPDVLYCWPSGRSATLHNEGLIKDLTPFLKADGIFGDYAPTTTAPQIGGILGELPNGITATSMMFVNTKVLRENGLEIPKTYDDLKAMVPVLNAKGIEVIQMDCKDGWVMQSCLFSLLVGRFGGSDWYDRLAAGEIDFEDEWFINALTVLDNLYKDGIINRNTLSIGYGSGRGDFANGKAAFYIDGDWAAASFQTDITTGQALFAPAAQESDLELINFPAVDGEIIHESNSVVVGTGWAMSADIPAGSAEEAAAWELIKFLEGEYVQTYRLTTGAAFPSLTTIDVAKVCEENNLEPLVAKRSDWYGRIQVATPVIDGVLDPAVYEVINTVLAEIGLGKTDVKTAAKTVNDAWNAWKN